MEINLSITGAFSKFHEIKDFFNKHNLLNSFNSVSVSDGVNSCAWNGGRLNRQNPVIESAKNWYKENRWGIGLLFTNDVINLDDSCGNSLLEEFHNENNFVVLVDDNLRKYIRSNFPKYKLKYSVSGCGEIQEYPLNKDAIDFYLEKQKLYDIVIPRPGSNMDDAITLLDPEKTEILVNIRCRLNCPNYSNHFGEISKLNRELFLPDSSLSPCTQFEYKLSEIKKINAFVDGQKDILKLLNKGFKNFKIAVRDEPRDSLFKELEYYLLP